MSVTYAHVCLCILTEVIQCTYSDCDSLLGICPKANSNKALLTSSTALFEGGK